MSLSHPLFDADELTRLGRASEAALSPDGTWMAVAVSRLDSDEAKYVSDLWRVSVVDPGAPPVRLTRGNCNDTRPCFRPDGSLGFLSNRPLDPVDKDRNGGEPRTQVWLIRSAGGEPEPLTDEPLGVSDVRFAKNTGQLFVIANVFLGIPHAQQRAHAADLEKRGPTGLHFTTMPVRHWDHWLEAAAPHVITFDPVTGERRDLTPDADREHRDMMFGPEWDVAPDGSRVAISALRPGPMRINDAALRIIDTAGGQHMDLGKSDNVEHSAPRFSPDSKAILCVRHVREKGFADRLSLWLFDDIRPDQPGRAVAPDWNVWPGQAEWTPDKKAVIVLADMHGQVPVFRVDIASQQVTRLSAESAGGSHMQIQVSSRRDEVVGLRHCLLHPPEPFRMDLRENAAPELVAELSGFSAGRGRELATWSSFSVTANDGAQVQSFLLMPQNPPDKVPALLWIHGGPMSQFTDGWHWRWNPLVAVAAGYAVLQPNPRGSTGFGQEFIQGIWNNEWGGACYRDLMAATDALCARDDIDETRVGAMGGSFGGYMANWLGVSTDRFRCLMTHAGLYDLAGFAGATDYPGYMYYEFGISPFEDREAFERFSPHRLVNNWKTPTLVIHGEKDYRVPIGEALHLFEALCDRGVDAELLVFPDENHWILRPQNIRQWYRVVLEFADKHLRAE